MKAEDIKNLKIAIVGAGYGGAAAAKALSLLGADVSVYEQASQMREVGAGIGLRPATMHRFRQWGIFDTIANVSSPSDYFEILTATGEPIMKDTWPEFGEQSQTHLIHRGDFIDALLSVLPAGHGAPWPQAGDHRGQGRPLRPDLHQRQDGRGGPGGRRRRHQVSRCASSSSATRARCSPANTPTAR